MKLAQGTTLITGGQLIPGTGAKPTPAGALVIQDGRIAFAGSAASIPHLPPDAKRIDARGGTVMPGLIEAHFHATYFNVASLEDLDIKYPVEYVTLLAATNARLARAGCAPAALSQAAGISSTTLSCGRPCIS